MPVTNESNHSAVVLSSASREFETSITTENMRGNVVTKSRLETPAIEMEDIDVSAPPLHNLSRISEEHIAEDKLQKQRIV